MTEIQSTDPPSDPDVATVVATVTEYSGMTKSELRDELRWGWPRLSAAMSAAEEAGQIEDDGERRWYVSEWPDPSEAVEDEGDLDDTDEEVDLDDDDADELDDDEFPVGELRAYWRRGETEQGNLRDLLEGGTVEAMSDRILALKKSDAITQFVSVATENLGHLSLAGAGGPWWHELTRRLDEYREAFAAAMDREEES